VVVDGARRLKGLLTERDVRFVNTSEGAVASRMTPVESLVTGQGELTMKAAEQIMVQRKVKKLPLVDANGTLIGLITAKDIHRQERLPFATRDAHGRLMVGAAIGATGDFTGRRLVKAHVDVIVIDIARPLGRDKAIDISAKHFPTIELVAGGNGHRQGVSLFPARRQRDGQRHRARRRLHDGIDDQPAFFSCRPLEPRGRRHGALIADGGIKRRRASEALLFAATR
jgi:IMP dehydrogenase